MEIIETAIEGVVIMSLVILKMGTATFLNPSIRENLKKKSVRQQDNESKSSCNVIRGLHFQKPPFAQSKLVRVVKGSVLDVAVELTGEKHLQFFIPRGFAHSFSVLSEEALAWDDPGLEIDWRIPIDKILLSEKDKKHPRLIEID